MLAPETPRVPQGFEKDRPKIADAVFYWNIRHETRGLIAAGTVPYASQELARAASARERLENSWPMGHGYYDEIVAR